MAEFSQKIRYEQKGGGGAVRLPVDPAGSSEHLTPDGKKKRRRRTPAENEAKMRRFDQLIDLEANEIVPTEVANRTRDPKPKKFWWERD